MKDNHTIYTLMTYSCWAFVILTGLAMIFYPGGSIGDHQATQYSFLKNFFSDLGRWKTFVGGTKYASFFLFAIALFQVAIISFIFNWKLTDDLDGDKERPWISKFALICGCIYSMAMFGIALTPYDLLLAEHMIAVKTCFYVLVPLCLSYSFLIYKRKHLPNRYASLFLVTTLMLIGYIYILNWGPKAKENEYLQTCAQKIIVYTLVFSLMYVAVGAKKYLHQPRGLK